MVRVQTQSVPFWKRLLAYLLDIFLLSFLVLGPLTKPFEMDSTGESLSEMLSVTFSSQYLGLAFTIAFFVLLYWSVLEFWFGQTFGKIILGLRVEGTKNKPLSFLQALIRNITKLSSLLLFFDTLYMFFTKKDQRYFESLSDTHVVVEVPHE
jgi:uncharacterized RDD family membrane protein YckC